MKKKFRIDVLQEKRDVLDIKWGILLGTMVYAYGGFDSLGSFAGEVKGGRRAFIAGIFGILPFNILNYMIPVCLGYMVHPHYKDWQSGYFTSIGFDLTIWLGIVMTCSAELSNFGMVNTIATYSRSVWAMARGKHQAKKLPTLIAWSWQKRDGVISPVAAILTSCIITLAFAALPFELLIELTLILRIMNLLLEYAALIKFRYSAPNAPRLFAVPGGKIGVWLLPVTTVIICVAEIITGKTEIVISGVIFNVVVALGFIVFRLARKARHKIRSQKRTRAILRQQAMDRKLREKEKLFANEPDNGSNNNINITSNKRTNYSMIN